MTQRNLNWIRPQSFEVVRQKTLMEFENWRKKDWRREQLTTSAMCSSRQIISFLRCFMEYSWSFWDDYGCITNTQYYVDVLNSQVYELGGFWSKKKYLHYIYIEKCFSNFQIKLYIYVSWNIMNIWSHAKPTSATMTNTIFSLQ